MRAENVKQPESNDRNSFLMLWERLDQASNREEFFHSWLALQCTIIPETVSAVLVMSGPDTPNNFIPVSRWPESGKDVEKFSEILDQTIDNQSGLLSALDSDAVNPHFALAYPIKIDGHLNGIVAVEVPAFREGDLKSAMEQLQWGVSWLELFYRREASLKDKADLKRLSSAVTLLSRVLAEERFEGAAMSFVTELSTELDCDRVSFGFVHKKKIQVKAFSHSAKFGERMNLIRSIGKAMDEAVIQRQEIAFPQDADHMVIVRDHSQLSQQYGAGTILTIPLYGNNRYYGAVTLERPPGNPFSDTEIEFCRSVVSLNGPVLESKRKEDRHLIFKVVRSFHSQAERLIGPQYIGRKLLALLMTAMVLFFVFMNGDYRVTADVILEGEMKRAASAPFSGYIKDSRLRAGDIVEKDTVLCLLDDSDLRLERLNWLSQGIQLKRQYQEALAQHNRSEINIINARIKQVDAQLELVENKLERTVIKAPYAGLIVTGDLTQSLGGMVQQGDVLFEIAPLQSYRVILLVDESRIADVVEGQVGTFLLPALSGERFAFSVEKITPISIAEEGQNRFRVEARLIKTSDQLRPGMEGVGKIMVDRRNLFSIWSRTLREKVKIWFWSRML